MNESTPSLPESATPRVSDREPASSFADLALLVDHRATRRSFQEALISLAIMLLLIGVLVQFWIYNRMGVWAVDRHHVGDFLTVAVAVSLCLCLLAVYRWHTLRRDLEWRQNVDKELLVLKEAVETMGIGMTITDISGRIRYLNRTEAHMHGYEPEQLIGQDVRILAPPELWQRLQPGDARNVGRWHRESVNLRRDGSTFPVHLMSNVVLDAHDDPIGIVTSCEDISDRKQAEQELRESRQRLRSLAHHLEVVRERERTHIAHEIHNDVGSALTVLKLDLSWIEQHVAGRVPELLPRIHRMLESIDSAVDMVRSIARQLRPFLLDDVGLNAAIEWQVDDIQERTGICCVARLPEDELPLDEEGRKTLYRVFQEALTNSLRHAQPQHVEVTLEAADGEAVLEVTDDGSGIDTERLHRSRGFGILAIRERASRVGGQVEISARKDRGTIVRARVPLAQEGVDG